MSTPGEEQEATAEEPVVEPRQMSERTAKIIMSVVAVGVMWAIVAAAPWVAYVVVGVFGTLGWQKAHTWIANRQGSGEDTEAVGDEDEEGDVLTRERLTRALHAVGAPHAHIAALAEYLGTTDGHVRYALNEAGIPRSGGVRMKGRPVAVSTGVKESDFPPLPSPHSEGDDEDVLTSNNNSNNAFDLVADETNSVRTHVRWRKP